MSSTIWSLVRSYEWIGGAVWTYILQFCQYQKLTQWPFSVGLPWIHPTSCLCSLPKWLFLFRRITNWIEFIYWTATRSMKINPSPQQKMVLFVYFWPSHHPTYMEKLLQLNFLWCGFIIIYCQYWKAIVSPKMFHQPKKWCSQNVNFSSFVELKTLCGQNKRKFDWR